MLLNTHNSYVRMKAWCVSLNAWKNMIFFFALCRCNRSVNRMKLLKLEKLRCFTNNMNYKETNIFFSFRTTNVLCSIIFVGKFLFSVFKLCFFRFFYFGYAIHLCIEPDRIANKASWTIVIIFRERGKNTQKFMWLVKMYSLCLIIF